jgi:hypothetical protein
MKSLEGHCGGGAYGALNVTHSSWNIKPRLLPTGWITVGVTGPAFQAEWNCVTLSPSGHGSFSLHNEKGKQVDIPRSTLT